MLNSTGTKIEAEKYGRKDRKVLNELMNNAAYVKGIENLWNKIDVKLVSSKKDYLKWTSKASMLYVAKNIW